MNDFELRHFEVRADATKDFCLTGTAVTYGRLSQDLGGFRERCAAGCFTRSLHSGDDVVALFNHDQNKVLGRLSAGTLTIDDDESRLAFRCQLDPNHTEHRNVYFSVKRGDVKGCSFAFTKNEGGDEWDEIQDERGNRIARRTLRSATLHDLSVVVLPAYLGDATSVSARAMALRFASKIFQQNDTDLRVKATRQAAQIDQQRMAAICDPRCRAVKLVDGHFERDFEREEEMRREEREYNHQLASELFPQYWN